MFPESRYQVAGCVGIGATTALGFAHLGATIPPERMGRTMGTAELGRELGDAGGPLLVGAVATVAGIATGIGALGLVCGAVCLLCGTSLRTPDTETLIRRSAVWALATSAM